MPATKTTAPETGGQWRRWRGLWLVAVLLLLPGCGTYFAKRLAQAPNTYPTWFAPKARVELKFGPEFLTNFPAKFVEVGPPAAKLRYRVVEPADYGLKVSVSNWTEHGEAQYLFDFRAAVPGKTNAWSGAPRGTVILLHGYGLAQFAMAPWALRLAEEGWRCVLVDLRGHGKSTGRRVFYGTRETTDLSQLLDALAGDGQLAEPVGVMGESYGAALALRWKGIEPRVGPVVAIAPYGNLSNAVLNIGADYVGWFPKWMLKSGIRNLPSVLEVTQEQLDTTSVLQAHPVSGLFIAAAEDKIAPADDVAALEQLAAPGSRLIIVPHATHEAVTYFFDELAQPVLAWLAGQSEPKPE